MNGRGPGEPVVAAAPHAAAAAATLAFAFAIAGLLVYWISGYSDN